MMDPGEKLDVYEPMPLRIGASRTRLGFTIQVAGYHKGYWTIHVTSGGCPNIESGCMVLQTTSSDWPIVWREIVKVIEEP